MFGLLTDVIDTAISMPVKLIDGELPSSHDVAKLIDAGVTVAAIAHATGFAEEVILELAKDD